MLIIRNVVRLHFVDHERKRTLLTRIRRSCTATATLRSCSRRTDSVGREIHQLRIALQTAQTRSEGPHWLYNKRGPGRESVRHNHLFGVLQGPHRKKRYFIQKAKKEEWEVFPCTLASPFLSSSSMFLLKGHEKKRRVSRQKLPFTLCKEGVKCWLHQFIFPAVWLTHTLLSLASILITSNSSYFYFLWLLVVYTVTSVREVEIVTIVWVWTYLYCMCRTDSPYTVHVSYVYQCVACVRKCK